MEFHPIDIVGLAGGVLLLFSFWRTSIGQWSGKSFWYEFDHLLAAILMSIYAFQKAAFISIVLNLVWGIAALHGVSSYAERRLKHNRKFNRAYRKAQALRMKVSTHKIV